MTSPTTLLARVRSSGRAATLVALAAALVVAFVAAPGPLAASRPGGGPSDARQLAGTFRESFVAYWGSGAGDLSPGLRGVVDYWFRYHVAKALIAAILLVVLGALGVLTWRAVLRPGARSAWWRAGLASAGALVTGLGLLSLVTVMANIQGAVAPFASLLPMLTDGPADPRLAATLAQVRQQLAGSHGAPAVDVMVGDVAHYHVAMAVIAGIVAAVLAVAGVASWRRFARTARAERRLGASAGLLAVLLSLVMTVVAVANATTAAHSAPALLALFEGGR